MLCVLYLYNTFLLHSLICSGNATEVYLFGTQLCVAMLGFIPGCLVVYYVLLPILHGLKLVSLNQVGLGRVRIHYDVSVRVKEMSRIYYNSDGLFEV